MIISAVIQGVAGIVAGLTIAFIASWQLTLIILGLIPIIGAAGYFQIRSLSGFGAKSRAAYENAGKTAVESIASIRTVITLTQEKTMSKLFEHHCQLPHSLTITGARVSALGFAFSQAAPFLAWSVAFFYGSRLVIWGIYDSQAIIQSMFAIIFTSMAAGQINNHTPDVAKANLAAVAITDLLDRTSKINHELQFGETRPSVAGQANGITILIIVNDAHFFYPTRPTQMILNGLNVNAKPGKTIALVGHSGCGTLSFYK